MFEMHDKDGNGVLTWNNGEIRDYVIACIRGHHLPVPIEADIYKLYVAFDLDKNACLDTCECVCLADALARAVIHRYDGKAVACSWEQQRAKESQAALALESRQTAALRNRKWKVFLFWSYWSREIREQRLNTASAGAATERYRTQLQRLAARQRPGITFLSNCAVSNEREMHVTFALAVASFRLWRRRAARHKPAKRCLSVFDCRRLLAVLHTTLLSWRLVTVGAEVQELRTRLISATTAAKSADGKRAEALVVELQEQLAQMHVTMGAAVSARSTAEAEVAELRMNLVEQTNACAATSADATEAEALISALQGQLAHTHAARSAAEGEVAKLRANLVDQTCAGAAVTADAARAEALVAELREQLTQTRSTMSTQVAELQAQLSQTRVATSTVASARSEAEAEIAKLRANLADQANAGLSDERARHKNWSCRVNRAVDQGRRVLLRSVLSTWRSVSFHLKRTQRAEIRAHAVQATCRIFVGLDMHRLRGSFHLWSANLLARRCEESGKRHQEMWRLQQSAPARSSQRAGLARYAELLWAAPWLRALATNQAFERWRAHTFAGRLSERKDHHDASCIHILKLQSEKADLESQLQGMYREVDHITQTLQKEMKAKEKLSTQLRDAFTSARRREGLASSMAQTPCRSPLPSFSPSQPEVTASRSHGSGAAINGRFAFTPRQNRHDIGRRELPSDSGAARTPSPVSARDNTADAASEDGAGHGAYTRVGRARYGSPWTPATATSWDEAVPRLVKVMHGERVH
jgi:hypothetical protein